MYKSSRNTDEWFDHNLRGTVHDKPVQLTVGPGKYSPEKSRSISHNTGKVPFGSQSQDRKDIFKVNSKQHLPGPGSY